jgi:ABC-2 type transport system permease protein
MNMFLHELKQNRKSAIIWIVVLVAVTAFYMALYQSFASETVILRKLLEGFPPAFRKVFGLTLETFATVNGFYSMILMYIMLAASIQAMILGTSIVSKEERGKTAEFLLSKPVARSQILNAKLMAALVIILVTNVVYLILVPLLTRAIVNTTIYLDVFLLLSLTIFFVQLFFLGFGFLISVSAPKIRSVLGVSLTTAFGFYIVGALDSIINSAAVRYLTPFKYFDFAYIVKNGTYEFRFLIFEAVLVAAAIVSSYYIYLKRDIRSV